MLLKWVRIIIFLISVNLIFAQDKEKKYIPSDSIFFQKLNESSKTDFNNRLRIALELKQKNPEIALYRFYEILILYKDFLKNNEYLEDILLNIYFILKNENRVDHFDELLKFLKKERILSEDMENKVINNLNL